MATPRARDHPSGRLRAACHVRELRIHVRGWPHAPDAGLAACRGPWLAYRSAPSPRPQARCSGPAAELRPASPAVLRMPTQHPAGLYPAGVAAEPVLTAGRSAELSRAAPWACLLERQLGQPRCCRPGVGWYSESRPVSLTTEPHSATRGPHLWAVSRIGVCATLGRAQIRVIRRAL
jgi:hypothetical protein